MSRNSLFNLPSFRKPRRTSLADQTPDQLQEQVSKLENILVERDSIITALEGELRRVQQELERSTGVVKRQHPLVPVVHEVEDKMTKKRRMGRHASITTTSILNDIQSKQDEEQSEIAPYKALAERVVEMFKNPSAHLSYLASQEFASDIMHLCVGVCGIFEEEKRCLFLQSPVYIFGDIHGNLEDLHFFSDNIWKLGMQLTAGKFLFLGDYVDRGLNSLEVVGYLFALKIMHPDKVFLLRGNHETRDVNGWEEHYGERSFLYQCKNRFGEDLGATVWEACNTAFDRLALSAIIDHDIFCVHGGIPRKVHDPNEDGANRVQDILNVPTIASINPPNDLETERSQQVACDCIWSDPAHDHQERFLDTDGFGESLRGGGAICFGMDAITEFLEEQGLSYIVRAHEAHAEGVALSKGARVFTVFSTSKDHGQGTGALAGCILVDFEQIHVINRSAAYKNKFVHRRGSLTLAGLSTSDLALRQQLGLVVEDPAYQTMQYGTIGEDGQVEEERDSQSNGGQQHVGVVVDHLNA